ncbi:MAG: hypothetical protein SXA11_12410 [Cyanobacteriota bacterium]|nr:hypothetical protein [Cyanobacteriota bacterium]
MKAFVGTREVANSDELGELLAKLAGEEKEKSSYYFLRSPHKIAGFLSELPSDFSSAAEGQMFNRDLELRWKRRGEKFSLLLLSRDSSNTEDFEPVGEGWKTSDRPAVLYQKEETRFPRRFRYGEKKQNLRQRYFQDAETSTVHFVALTLS